MSNYIVNAGFPAGNACTGSTVAKGDVKLPYLKAIPALRSKKRDTTLEGRFAGRVLLYPFNQDKVQTAGPN